MLWIVRCVPLLLVVASSVVLAGPAAAQTTRAQDRPGLRKNSVYATGLELYPTGPNTLIQTYSVSYERLVWSASWAAHATVAVRLRAGAGYGESSEGVDDGGEAYIAPLMASASVGTQRHQFEGGAGVLLERWRRHLSSPMEWTFGATVPRFYAGYRLGIGPFLTRLTAAVAWDERLVVLPGLSVGVQF